MKLWLDDCRPAPEGWRWVKTSDEAIHALQTESVEEISLDHDLGAFTTCGSGMEVARFIEGAAHDGKLPRLKWALHTANPVGRKNMKAALTSADQQWSARGL